MADTKKRTYEVDTSLPFSLTNLNSSDKKGKEKEQWVMYIEDNHVPEKERSHTVTKLIDRVKKI